MFGFSRRPVPKPIAPEPVKPEALAMAFGLMLARKHPDRAYDLADLVAKGVGLGLKGES